MRPFATFTTLILKIDTIDIFTSIVLLGSFQDLRWFDSMERD